MSILVYAEHDNNELKSETAKLVFAASQHGDVVDVLVVETSCKASSMLQPNHHEQCSKYSHSLPQ